jgi:O-antigen ligase
MSVTLTTGRFDRARLAIAADGLAVAVAVALPWSTSVTLIAIAVWFLALLPTLDAAAVRRQVETPAGGLPVLLVAFAALGMLWADVGWAERIDGLGGFYRLLAIPLLLLQFRRSDHGVWVIYGLLTSATLLLLVSWALVLLPGLSWRGKTFGVPVRDYIFQSTLFMICAFALVGRLCDAVGERNWRIALGAAALAALFLANIAFVATSRTVLVVAAVLLVLLGWRRFGWKGALTACLAAAVLGSALWFGSPYLRARVLQVVDEVHAYGNANAETSTGLRLEFWKKSLAFVREAPLVGHGTGSVTDQFRRAAAGQTGAGAVASVNPHNQIFAIAIQLGAVGAALLVAMWLAHLALFRGSGFVAWAGAVVVVQNVVSCLANSHLFDFGHGWLYVFGVGVLGGMALRERAPPEMRA